MPPPKLADLSYLQVVDLCDNVDLRRDAPDFLYDAKFDVTEQLIPFALTEDIDSPIIGLLRPPIVKELIADNARNRQQGTPEVWNLRLEPSEHRTLSNGRSVGPCISFQSWLDDHEKRTAAMKEICERWRDTGLFSEVCGPTKWRNEMYPIYADPFGAHDHPTAPLPDRPLNYVFEMERSACALFGVITYGVHMTIYEHNVDDDGQTNLKIWVPTRALTKPTWPGFLDNTVAGGIPSGMSPFESLVKECMEEASLPDHVVRKHIKAVGAISYTIRTTKGWLQPEVEYVYDLVIPPNSDPALFQPKPLDGEVESFELMSQERVIKELRAGQFKPNCGMGVSKKCNGSFTC
ncbi:nudix hydrolase 20, variant 3 [Coprinopsis cinerea AmutBmut pab1-1]|nr:nudix hydrolase 20, variant 3 [Coprinopsis cinerea AmutBmut pab1-1]